MLCKGKDNLPYTKRRSQESVRQPSTRSVFRPVLVGEVTSTTSRRDQYCLLWVTSTGPIADQYWSHLPPAVHSGEIAPKKAPLIRSNSPYCNNVIPQAERAQSPSPSRRREKCPTAPLREGISRASHRTLISEPLLVCARTTLGMGVKPLLVSGVNHYWVALETTTGMRANNYCFTFTHLIASPSRATYIGRRADLYRFAS